MKEGEAAIKVLEQLICDNPRIQAYRKMLAIVDSTVGCIYWYGGCRTIARECFLNARDLRIQMTLESGMAPSDAAGLAWGLATCPTRSFDAPMKSCTGRARASSVRPANSSAGSPSGTRIVVTKTWRRRRSGRWRNPARWQTAAMPITGSGWPSPIEIWATGSRRVPATNAAVNGWTQSAREAPTCCRFAPKPRRSLIYRARHLRRRHLPPSRDDSDFGNRSCARPIHRETLLTWAGHNCATRTWQ